MRYMFVFSILLMLHSESDQSKKTKQIVENESNETYQLIKNASYIEEIFDADTIRIILPANMGLVKLSALHMTAARDIIISDRHFAKKVLLFNRSGEFVKQVGRSGQGPGEYVDPAHIGSNKRNEIVLADYALSRISFFGDDGAFLHSFNVPHRIDGMFLSGNDEIIVHDLVNRANGESIKIYSRQGKLLRKFGERSYAFQELMNFPFRPPGPYLTIDGESIYQTDYADYHVRKYSTRGGLQFEFGVEPGGYRSPLSTNYKRVTVTGPGRATQDYRNQLADYLKNEFSKCTYVSSIAVLCPGIVYQVMVDQSRSFSEKGVYFDFYNEKGLLLKSGLSFKHLSPEMEFMVAPPNRLLGVKRQSTDKEDLIQLIEMTLKTSSKN